MNTALILIFNKKSVKIRYIFLIVLSYPEHKCQNKPALISGSVYCQQFVSNSFRKRIQIDINIWECKRGWGEERYDAASCQIRQHPTPAPHLFLQLYIFYKIHCVCRSQWINFLVLQNVHFIYIEQCYHSDILRISHGCFCTNKYICKTRDDNFLVRVTIKARNNVVSVCSSMITNKFPNLISRLSSNE